MERCQGGCASASTAHFVGHAAIEALYAVINIIHISCTRRIAWICGNSGNGPRDTIFTTNIDGLCRPSLIDIDGHAIGFHKGISIHLFKSVIESVAADEPMVTALGFARAKLLLPACNIGIREISCIAVGLLIHVLFHDIFDGTVINVNGIGNVAICLRLRRYGRVLPIDDLHRILGKVLDCRLSFIRNVGKIRLGIIVVQIIGDVLDACNIVCVLLHLVIKVLQVLSCSCILLDVGAVFADAGFILDGFCHRIARHKTVVTFFHLARTNGLSPAFGILLLVFFGSGRSVGVLEVAANVRSIDVSFLVKIFVCILRSLI